jgi:hypothetical protein
MIDTDEKAAGVAWLSSARTPTREGARSMPNLSTLFLTLEIGASLLFWDLAGRLCLNLRLARMVLKNSDFLKNLVARQPDHKPDPQ